MSAKGATSSTTKSSSSSSDEQQSSSSNQVDEQPAAVKIKDEPVDLTETESYKTLIEHEINDLLAERLSQLILDNKLSISEFDDNAYGSIKRINDVEEGLNILNDFEQADEEKLKDGRINYLCELITKSEEERVNGEPETSELTTPNGESSSSNQQSPAKSSTTATTTNQQQYPNNSNSQNQLEELKKKCDEISQRTGKCLVNLFKNPIDD